MISYNILILNFLAENVILPKILFFRFLLKVYLSVKLGGNWGSKIFIV